MILISLVSFAWLPAVQTSTTVVDFVIWLETPEKQFVIDEMITKTESLGLVVNPIYVTFNEWIFYAHGSHDYDLLYGPYMTIPKDMDIFFIAFIEYILTIAVLSYDNKIYSNTGKLFDMYFEAMMNPDVVDEEFINDMVDKFHDNQERYWEKQYYSVFVQFETPYSDEWGQVPSMRTDTINYNCEPGRVFADTDLRLQLNSIIDRTVFLNYYAQYTSYSVYEVHHLYQFSPFHDSSLPNNYNF
jgi:hypothetical protein